MSELRTARDLTVPGHAEEARAALHRAIDRNDDAALAAWARRWGESAIDVTEALEDAECADPDLEEAA